MQISYRFYISFFILIFVNLSLYTEIVPFFHHEPQRTLIAQEMLIKKEFIKPTVMGKDYFNKPPLQNWLIALTSIKSGVISNFKARLISIISFILLGISMLFVFKDTSDGIKASLITISSYVLLFSYANQAEIDMLFTFLMFASYFLFIKSPSSYFFIAASAIFMGLSILAKGISPILFYPPVFFYILISEKGNIALLKMLLLHFVIAITLPVIWLALLSLDINLLAFLENARSEMLNRGSFAFKDYLYHLLSFPLRMLVATVPYSIVLIFYFKKGLFKDIPVYMSSLLIFSWIFILMLFFPAGSGRYFMPAIPFFAIIASYHINCEKSFSKVSKNILLFLFFITLLAGSIFYLFKGYIFQPAIFTGTMIYIYYYFKKPAFNIIKETSILVMIFSIIFFHGYYFYRSKSYYNYNSLMLPAELTTSKTPIVFDKIYSRDRKLAIHFERISKKVVYIEGVKNFDNYYYVTNKNNEGCNNLSILTCPKVKGNLIYILNCAKVKE